MGPETLTMQHRQEGTARVHFSEVSSTKTMVLLQVVVAVQVVLQAAVLPAVQAAAQTRHHLRRAKALMLLQEDSDLARKSLNVNSNRPFTQPIIH